MMTYDYYQDYNPINIIVMFISTFQFLQTLENALETEAQFYNLDSPSQFKVSYHQRIIAFFITSIIISKLHHHGRFDHQQQHLGQFIRPSYVQKQRI